VNRLVLRAFLTQPRPGFRFLDGLPGFLDGKAT
jgi:hypothetical protein